MFVAGIKSDFIDTNTTVNTLNITEKGFLFVSGYVTLKKKHLLKLFHLFFTDQAKQERYQ